MEREYGVRRITRGPAFHFKAYYDIQPWNITGRFFLCMRSDFQDRPPSAGDTCTLGVVDLDAGESFVPLAETRAWNFQQGCMPHWMPTAPDREVIYNDTVGEALRAVVLDIGTGEKRILPKPVQALTPDGKFAACLNYPRWGDERPGYGYAGVKDPYEGLDQPPEDAVHVMDLETGRARPVVFLPEVARLTSDNDVRRGSFMYFCHLMFNTDGTRLAGIARWWCPAGAKEAYRSKLNVDGAVPERRHCLWTVNTDGTDLNIVVNDGLVSHADWRDPEHILAWAGTSPGEAPAYRVFDARDNSHRVIGRKCLLEDGHMSYHRNVKWLLTDTYPDRQHRRTLKLYNIEEKRELVLGRFHAPPDLRGELRCDLHPCWNREYDMVAIDSIHEGGSRQVYVVNVGTLE